VGGSNPPGSTQKKSKIQSTEFKTNYNGRNPKVFKVVILILFRICSFEFKISDIRAYSSVG
ncbi:MAG: hypothetical protein U0944_03055, partial [Candidatus Moranbacteria bacterium]|nr:hypothetical protein [Candidatus Moranbacteria bacterium]